MPRAIWKGSISFGLVNVPVGLYSAESRDDLSLKMLDRRNMSPVGYVRVNKKTDEEVPWDEIVRGYEYEDGRYVILTEEDFRQANVEATRTVEIVDFVDGSEIEPTYYDKPYYLAPLKRDSKGYALLRETLRRTGKVGIAKVVIRTREYLAALVARGPVMILDVLRYAYELRDPGELEVPEDDLKALGVTDREIGMAERLVEEMVVAWEPEKYRDTYREDILARVEQKVKAGQAEEVVEPAEGGAEEEVEVIDIMSLLKRSVSEASQQKGRAGGKGGAKPAAKRRRGAA